MKQGFSQEQGCYWSLLLPNFTESFFIIYKTTLNSLRLSIILRKNNCHISLKVINHFYLLITLRDITKCTNH